MFNFNVIQIVLGIASSLSFLFGSFMFLPQFAAYSVTGVWLFALGSFLMLVCYIGQALISVTNNKS